MVRCDAEYCEYNCRGICHTNPDMDGNGVCMTITTIVRDENEDKNEDKMITKYPYTDANGFIWHDPDCYTDDVGGEHDSGIG